MFYIGLMSGTSMDAVDAALIRIVGDRPEVIRYQQTPLATDLRRRLRAVNGQTPLIEWSALDAIVGEQFAAAALAIIDADQLSPGDVCAIGSHGQTVLHLPRAADHPRTVQLGDPNIIACRTAITTVADFRRMDLAAGGEGAPLAPVLHQALLGDRGRCDRVVLNIGGIANITVIPSDHARAITGFDTGPGNGLMDVWIQHRLAREFDSDGRWAGTGACHAGLLASLLDDAYFALPPPKSTGKDRFNLGWIMDKLAMFADAIAPEDVQATLLELSAITISDAINQAAPEVGEVLVCGGGAHNRALMERLRALHPSAEVVTTEHIGIAPDAVEAVAFAWLAKCRLECIPGNVIGVTRAQHPVVLGGVYTSTGQAVR